MRLGCRLTRLTYENPASEQLELSNVTLTYRTNCLAKNVYALTISRAGFFHMIHCDDGVVVDANLQEMNGIVPNRVECGAANFVAWRQRV